MATAAYSLDQTAVAPLFRCGPRWWHGNSSHRSALDSKFCDFSPHLLFVLYSYSAFFIPKNHWHSQYSALFGLVTFYHSAFFKFKYCVSFFSLHCSRLLSFVPLSFNVCIFSILYHAITPGSLAWKVGILSMWGWVSSIIWLVNTLPLSLSPCSLSRGLQGGRGGTEGIGGSGGVL
jgi:hypothetical protein